MNKLIFIFSLIGISNLVYAAPAESQPAMAKPTKIAASASVASTKISKPAASAVENTDKTVVIVAPATNCDSDSPCDVIKTSATQLSQAVNQDISEKETMDLIENSIVPQIDFYLMTKFVMGSTWKQASAEQQTQIVNLFKQLLVYQYSAALSRFKGAQVSIDSSLISGEKQNKAAVKGTVKLPSNGSSKTQPVNIEYDLAKINGDWKIYDVKIENVSIVTTYRSQFNDTIQASGVAGLIKQLQTKVDSLKAKN